MNRFVLPLAAFALLLVVLLVGLKRAPEKNNLPSPLIGKSAPQFTLPNLFDNTRPLSSEALKGHWSLVNVWGSWCVSCRAEHSTLLMIQQQGRVPIIGIDWNDDDHDAIDWLSQLGNPYTRVGLDHDGHVAIDWGVYGAPESFLISPVRLGAENGSGLGPGLGDAALRTHSVEPSFSMYNRPASA